eukprot:TRINITY_DN73324_c0_g1_i1.p1 TRINITY_DN73324_c0_g1~~TRINITY_DN73324_c0_g1_i1.p1  ORF type:complete len:1284 (+),score=210.47 TRINITY_DN73324_c0_g1_i1:66-3917(+)
MRGDGVWSAAPRRVVAGIFFFAVLAGASLGDPVRPHAVGEQPPPWPWRASSFWLNGSAHSWRYDGHGAVSAGAKSRLLFDYPEPQRTEILDYLFKPKFGASLHQIKVEIGGDGQTGYGTEPSHRHSLQEAGSCSRGYELWLLSEARRRNPSIVIYASAWAVPGWVGKREKQLDGLYTEEGLQYLLDWLACVQQLGIGRIDYLGQRSARPKTPHGFVDSYRSGSRQTPPAWTETVAGGLDELGYNESWTRQLRAVLDAQGFGATKLVLPDQFFEDPEAVLGLLTANSTYLEVLEGGVLGVQYPCFLPRPEVAAAGLKYWSSEDGALPGNWSGCGCIGRTLNQNFVRQNMTSTVVRSLLWSVYPGFGESDSLIDAYEPWSGRYLVRDTVWALAHTTQFTEVGWRILGTYEGEAGQLGSSGPLSYGGTYVTYVSPDGADFTIVVEKLHGACHRCTVQESAEEKLNFKLTGSFANLNLSTLAVWVSNATHRFIRLPDLNVDNETLAIEFVARPDSIYSITTTSGQHRGMHMPKNSSNETQDGFMMSMMTLRPGHSGAMANLTLTLQPPMDMTSLRDEEIMLFVRLPGFRAPSGREIAVDTADPTDFGLFGAEAWFQEESSTLMMKVANDMTLRRERPTEVTFCCVQLPMEALQNDPRFTIEAQAVITGNSMQVHSMVVKPEALQQSPYIGPDVFFMDTSLDFDSLEPRADTRVTLGFVAPVDLASHEDEPLHIHLTLPGLSRAVHRGLASAATHTENELKVVPHGGFHFDVPAANNTTALDGYNTIDFPLFHSAPHFDDLTGLLTMTVLPGRSVLAGIRTAVEICCMILPTYSPADFQGFTIGAAGPAPSGNGTHTLPPAPIAKAPYVRPDPSYRGVVPSFDLAAQPGDFAAFGHFPLPHLDDFDHYPVDATPRFFADYGGSWQVAQDVDMPGNRVLKQWLESGNGPNQWTAEAEPITLLGFDISDAVITADLRVPQDTLRLPPKSGAGPVLSSIQSTWAGLCFSTAAGAAWEHTPVTLGFCSLDAPRLFRFDRKTGQIAFGNSRKCLTIRSCDRESQRSSDICLQDCELPHARPPQKANQSWTWGDDGAIRNREEPQLCITAKGRHEGAALRLQPCTGDIAEYGDLAPPEERQQWLATGGGLAMYAGVCQRLETPPAATAEVSGLLASRGMSAPGRRIRSRRGYCLVVGIDRFGRSMWQLQRGGAVILAQGRAAAFAGVWQRLRLEAQGSQLRAVLNGQVVARVVDSTYAMGMTALCTGWGEAIFDNFVLEPLPHVPHVGGQPLTV